MKRVVGFGAAAHQGDWPLQEDAYWIDPVRGAFALADGFGGPGSGDRAAAEAARAAGEFLASPEREETRESAAHPFFSPEEAQVAEAIRRAAAAVDAVNSSLAPDARGGASLVVCLSLPSGRVVVGNIGNTGAAILRAGKVVPLLQPQSFSVSQGGAPGQPHARFGRDFPLQFLGLFAQSEPEVRTYHFQGRDKLILFTEGLVAGRLEILAQASVLLEADQASRAPGAASDRLEDMAKEVLELAKEGGGSTRNQSVVLVEL